MYECNAMQLLETKEKNTKTKKQRQWSQRKSNEAQRPYQKDSVSLSLLHPKLFRTNKCYRILCLRYWHFWLICSLSSLQLVTVWTNVSRLPTKMTHLCRLTMHLILRKSRYLRFRLFQINPNLSRWCNFYGFNNLTNRGFDSFTHNFTHRRFRRR